MDSKVCNRCGCDKPLALFTYRKMSNTYLGNCRVCAAAVQRERYHAYYKVTQIINSRNWQKANRERWNAYTRVWQRANRERLHTSRPERVLVGEKICYKCKEVKSFAQFTPLLHGKFGYCSYCKPCNAKAEALRRARRFQLDLSQPRLAR